MYAIMAMRVDIVFAMTMMSQFMSKAGPLLQMVVKHIMRYLKGTLDFKLYLGGKDITLRGFCDADWAEDTNDQRSTTGYAFFVGIGVIS